MIVALSTRAHEGRVRADGLAKDIEKTLLVQKEVWHPELNEEARVREVVVTI